VRIGDIEKDYLDGLFTRYESCFRVAQHVYKTGSCSDLDDLSDELRTSFLDWYKRSISSATGQLTLADRYDRVYAIEEDVANQLRNWVERHATSDNTEDGRQ
jgi:hypothetical protein